MAIEQKLFHCFRYNFMPEMVVPYGWSVRWLSFIFDITYSSNAVVMLLYLLPNTKLAKDIPQQIIGRNLTGDFT